MGKGVNRLAGVISDRINLSTQQDIIAEFGKIQEDGSLLTDSFPIPIPRSDYLTAGNIVKEQADNNVQFQVLQPGNRVLVLWVKNDAVVIATLNKGDEWRI